MTATVQRRPPSSEEEEPLLLPQAPNRLGPASRRLLLRLLAGLAVVEVVGSVLIFAVGGDRARAAGTSLVFPGTGFTYVAWPVLSLVTIGLLVVALVLWWGASVHLAIPLVWGASALGAAALAGGPRLVVEQGTTWPWAVPVAYAAAAGTVGLALIRSERAFRAKRAQIPELNAYLAAAPPPAPRAPVRAPDAMDIALLRWCYDFARQPADELVGLDWGEQFHSGTQLRYQLNALSWSLSLYAANFVPNALPQAETALARVIERHTDLRVWGYWRTLNLLGNFDPDPDPIARDNIMFSAFLGDVLNVFEAATGSDRFDQPGSLTFVWKDGRTFAYDHHRIAEAVERNYQRSRLGFYPCEPGWSFTVCNVMGAQALFGHDQLHDTDSWSRIGPRWVETLDGEYSTPDGSYAHIKSNLVGLAWDTGEVPGGHYLAAGSNRFADILPAHARRAAALERRRAQKLRPMAASVVDGRLHLELPETLERSRARRSALAAWNGVIGGARLIGEHALADAALDASARQCGTGERWPGRPLRSGLQGFGGHMMVRWSAPLTTAELIKRGYQAPTGPVLADAPWDDVVVTEARSADGVRLRLRLEPWDKPVPAAALVLTQLSPGTAYRIAGGTTEADLTADAAGTARVTVPVTGPVELVVAPTDRAGGGES
jgi:hypothetical protein